MSTFRRVVTGHDGRGRSVIASDQKVAGVAVPGMPGVELTTLWGSDHTMRYPDDGSMPRSATWFAPVGGFRLIEFIIGPENPQIAVDHDPAASRAEVDGSSRARPRSLLGSGRSASRPLRR